MRRNLSLFLLMIFAVFTVNAQKNQAELISSTNSETIIKFNVNSYNLQDVLTQNGKEFAVKAEEGSAILQAGAPDLMKFTKSIIIPDKAKMIVEIIDAKYKDITIATNIAPSKGNFSRTIDPATVPYTYGEVYQKDEFFPGKITDLNTPYVARDFRGQAVNIYPFQYNPVSKIMRIYTELTIKISATSETGENVFNRTRSNDKVSTEFKNIYSSHFMNYQNSRYTAVEEAGKMLIICYDDWTAEMQPLVDWKNKIGRPCEMVTVTEAGGSSSAIKTYVENYYNTNGLTYLLLVGDNAQCPTIPGPESAGSDNSYAYITGNDHYLEFFVGRFSAETAAHVSTQVQRVLTYENGSTLGNGWLNKALGVTSAQGDGQGDDGEADFAHYRNMATDLLGFTYTESAELFDGSQGGNDASGDPTPAMVGDEINSGKGIALYTGHGGETMWVSSGFSVSDINNLTNDNKLPFIFDVACVNGAFRNTTCFGEAWLRAENGGEPTGAIAIVASTINQSWAPPMIGQDEMVDILVESYSNNIKRTFTGIAVNGMFQMNDESSDWNMTDTWTTFGDPSLLVRTDDPANMVISHNATALVGEATFAVNCDFDGAFACISKDGAIIGTATVSGGVANVPLAGVNPGDQLTVAVTGFNKVTYLSDITVIAPSGPYIVVDNATINGNTSLDFAQTGNIDITLKNVGPESASGITATLTTTDEYVTSLTNNTDVNFGAIAGNNGTAVSSASFSVTLANNVPDQHLVSFDIVISDGSKTTWNSTVNITANAPAFEITGMTISNDDNANGRLDPAETADLTFEVKNTGHANATDVMSELLGDSPYFFVTNNNQSINIDAAGTTNVVFSVEANENTAQGTPVNLTNNVEKNIVYTASFNQELIIGQAAEKIVGEGNETSGKYPFYTYYENNKTQILYLGSEIGAGTVNIQEIAFDFTNIDATITELKNLKIKLKETDITEFSTSYDDMSESTLVLTSASYTMPQVNGWYSFDIDDYSFDTSKNLIVEILWGDNGEFGNYGNNYKLNCTTTTQTSVVFGFDDGETPPTYDDNSKVRPNIKFFFEAQASGTEYAANFTVQDESGNPIPNAVVCVGSQDKIADASGQTSFTLIEGNYTYEVSASGYGSVTNSLTVDEEENITVTLGVSSVNQIENKIKIYPNPTNGLVNINLENESLISIYNISGQLILTKKANNNTQVDLSLQAKGIYFIRISSEGKNYNHKIIIE